MTARPRLLVVWGIAPILLVTILSLWRPPLLANLEYLVYDTIVRAAPTNAPGDRIVIVDVDERSLALVGQWPWRRDLIAGLITRLRDHGAAVVALDIIFAERDRYEGNALVPDRALADALQPGRVVLGYGITFDPGSDATGPCVQHPLGLVVLGQLDEPADPPFFHATGAVCSLPMLATAAGASGFLNAAPDADGLLRRVPMLIERGGHVYPSLGLAAVTAITGAQNAVLHVANVNASQLTLSTAEHESPEGSASEQSRQGALSVPLDGKSNLLLRYRGAKRTFRYVSAADVLSGRATADVFKDKLVLVGTTALGTREVVSTPLDTLFTGVEVQATIADNLLQKDFVHRPEDGVAIETLAVLVFGVAATLLTARVGIAWGGLAAAIFAASGWAASVSLMAAGGLFLSPLFPMLGLTASFAATVVAGLTVERRRADRAGVEKETSQRLMVQTLLSLTEIKDAETGKHSRRTQQYTRVLAQELSHYPEYDRYLTPERIDLLATLAPLHDIGKVGVPDRVLNKPGSLTPEELVEMRKHPVHGRDVIVNAEREAGVRDDVTLAIAKDIVYTHHEKWDGTGYPEGLRGTAIPIPGRVMALVDVYDAVLTRRLYAPALSQEDAMALIVKGRGTHFDPAVVDAFLKVSPIMRTLSESADH
jgi:CHASE2 domain-containing sensor protein